MPNYVISVRRDRKGQFDAEPGKARFLKVPSNQLPKPVHEISRADWVAQVIQEAHDHVNEHTGVDCGDILVFIHGYNNSAKSIMWRHRRLASDLRKVGYTGAFVSFDRPSDDRGINYLEDRSDAKKTAMHLVRILVILITGTGFIRSPDFPNATCPMVSL